MFNQIQIQTRTGCNLKCPMCPNSYMKQPKKAMSKVLFTKIINELSQKNYNGIISLYLMNEPFLDERLPYFVALTRLKLPEARINISTNGIIPYPRSIKELKGLSDCDVSCYTKDIWDKWKDEDVNAINMVDHKYKYDNRGGNIEAGKDKLAYIKCERPFVQMYINAFGQAILCCSDYKFEVVMGDVRTTTLEDIWNGEVYKKYRETLSNDTREGLKLCEICNYPQGQ